MKHSNKYDVIVVGGGHAGCEAAYAAGKMGANTLLVTMNMQAIGQMSCNPAMGGVAKGQIVREIDALGGMSGIVTDETMIQFRMLNRSKGPAMWSPRAQSDRMLFAEKWRLVLESNPNVDFYQEMITSLIVEQGRVIGVNTALGIPFYAKAVVLTNGTFLNGLIHIGEQNYGGGRMGERGATGITEQLNALGFESGRMKTGTPPRVDGRSLDYSKFEEQFGDAQPSKFSYTPTRPLAKQRSCWITYTNPEVHDLLREGFDRSPMFNGAIQSTGPRYCPSIEDKINRFADKDRHQIFVEPEGWNTVEMYINGFSTSLPHDVQLKAIQSIPGFANAKIFRPGYAIEYDYFPPTQIKHTLETKLVTGLYFAGQINGTTGYEEAACQGLMAGINAALQVFERPAFILDRSEAYIGVLIDDLITKGTEEPYRMFTSRAEFRLLLRQDNADQRLTPKGVALGLADESRMLRLEEKLNKIAKLNSDLTQLSVEPSEVNDLLDRVSSSPIKQRSKAVALVSRPQLNLRQLNEVATIADVLQADDYSEEEIDQVEIAIKYAGYIEREQQNVDKMVRLQELAIPEQFDYQKVKGLSTESRQKFEKIRPTTLSQASRISGVSPADLNVLLIYLGR
ncbi:MAG: tRNA uridine-5-carboxymethylaminomethyl(34) synthesis enzyme MnmG [Schleiferiaceae bacterium]|nr:tRNA uridine-5-carboxymethylaminomethyl(34) synthesis enzyme MnmG [Schleiferiaceae bacterium]